MKCKCGSEMKLLYAWDDAQQTDCDHAFNVWACTQGNDFGCGLILKDSIWNHSHKVWLGLDIVSITGDVSLKVRA